MCSLPAETLSKANVTSTCEKGALPRRAMPGEVFGKRSWGEEDCRVEDRGLSFRLVLDFPLLRDSSPGRADLPAPLHPCSSAVVSVQTCPAT